MKSNKGITLISVIMTVLLLAIIGGLVIRTGIDTFKRAKVVKFETYMKMLQKKVDSILEEGIDYKTLGTQLSSENKLKLQKIISDNSSVIETTNVEEPKLRYFSSNDILDIFEIKDVDDEIVVNFANREVISLNGVEQNGTMHYVEYSLH